MDPGQTRNPLSKKSKPTVCMLIPALSNDTAAPYLANAADR